MIKENGLVTVDASATLNEEAPYEYVSKMRASVLVMGPLLASRSCNRCITRWLYNWCSSN